MIYGADSSKKAQNDSKKGIIFAQIKKKQYFCTAKV